MSNICYRRALESDAKKIVDFYNFVGGYLMIKLNKKLSKLLIITISTSFISATNAFASENTSNLTISNNVITSGKDASGVITLPSDVSEIDELAFNNNDNITKVIIPSNIKKIGYGCFANCKNLKEVVIDVFNRCESLEKVTIPASVKSIGEFAFGGCKKLKDVDFQSKTTDISPHAFIEVPWIEDIRDDYGLVIINNAIISAKNVSYSFTIPNDIKMINEEAFIGCENLKEINIPDSVVEIKGCAFQGCKKLSKVKLSNKLETIGSYAFYDCNISTIKIPSTLKSVKLDSFNDKVTFTGDVDLYNSLIKPLKTAEEDKLDVWLHRVDYGWGKTADGRVFYKNSQGELQTGWMDLNGKKYYFYSNGQLATGFIDLNGTKYYLDPSSGDNFGNMIIGWKYINNNWYYFNPYGEGDKVIGFMKTAWLYDGGNWYYMYSDGTMATGFINLNGAYYYLNNSGAMVTGWQYINNSWYYFNKSYDGGIEGLMKKGWNRINGVWYYFNYSDGKMAHDQWIDGYYVNSSGAWV